MPNSVYDFQIQDEFIEFVGEVAASHDVLLKKFIALEENLQVCYAKAYQGPLQEPARSYEDVVLEIHPKVMPELNHFNMQRADHEKNVVLAGFKKLLPLPRISLTAFTQNLKQAYLQGSQKALDGLKKNMEALQAEISQESLTLQLIADPADIKTKIDNIEHAFKNILQQQGKILAGLPHGSILQPILTETDKDRLIRKLSTSLCTALAKQRTEAYENRYQYWQKAYQVEVINLLQDNNPSREKLQNLHNLYTLHLEAEEAKILSEVALLNKELPELILAAPQRPYLLLPNIENSPAEKRLAEKKAYKEEVAHYQKITHEILATVERRMKEKEEQKKWYKNLEVPSRPKLEGPQRNRTPAHSVFAQYSIAKSTFFQYPSVGPPPSPFSNQNWFFIFISTGLGLLGALGALAFYLYAQAQQLFCGTKACSVQRPRIVFTPCL